MAHIHGPFHSMDLIHAHNFNLHPHSAVSKICVSSPAGLLSRVTSILLLEISTQTSHEHVRLNMSLPAFLLSSPQSLLFPPGLPSSGNGLTVHLLSNLEDQESPWGTSVPLIPSTQSVTKSPEASHVHCLLSVSHSSCN